MSKIYIQYYFCLKITLASINYKTLKKDSIKFCIIKKATYICIALK